MVIHMIHLGVLQNFLLYEQHSDTPWCVMFHLGVLQNVLLYEQHSDTYDPPWCVTKLPLVRATK